MICDDCGAELKIGDFPFCKGDPSAHTPTTPMVIDDQLEGGARFFEHMGPQPVYCATKTEWKRALKERGLRCVG